uniref:uridine/cytidine kinase n=1 Tax=Cyprinus carpio TaxID=7962 RepID=A0A8C1TN25_CYPCA
IELYFAFKEFQRRGVFNHVFIGLCGGSASGKTTVANKIIEALDVPWVVLLSMDSFYKVLSPEEQALAASNDYNFDHPGAFDFELLVTTLRKLKQGQSVKIPVYDFTTHGCQKDWVSVCGRCFTYFPELMDKKIFVDTDSYIRLVRQLRRDITERGCDIEGQYIEPTMRLADIVVPRGGNMVAIDLIVQHVHSQLEEVSEKGHYGMSCEIILYIFPAQEKLCTYFCGHIGSPP